MKILTIDIETMYGLAHVWQAWKNDIHLSQIEELPKMISFAAKWKGDSKVEFRSTYHDTEEVMLKRLWELIDEADVIVHFNGERFDLPWINTAFALNNLGPPSPVKSVDLIKTVKKKFYLFSNKLQHVTTLFGLEGKLSHEGHLLWVACRSGDVKAWDRMKRYNIQDVKVTEQLFDKIFPWLVGLPNANLYVDSETEGCFYCTSNNIQKRGFTYTGQGRFQRWHCTDCGRWSSDNRRIKGSMMKEAR